MTILDDNYAPPLLWGTAKLSAWYAVGLLARQASGDVERANKLLHNCLTQQYRDERFTRNYGSFKQQHVVPFCGTPNSVWEVGEIYDAYDPNNGLFVTMAGVMIHARYKHLIEEELWTRFGEAMVVACQGQAMRRGGEDGDDLWPAYSNVSERERCASGKKAAMRRTKGEIRRYRQLSSPATCNTTANERLAIFRFHLPLAQRHRPPSPSPPLSPSSCCSHPSTL